MFVLKTCWQIKHVDFYFTFCSFVIHVCQLQLIIAHFVRDKPYHYSILVEEGLK